MSPAPSGARVAFVTSSDYPDLTSDDRLASAALASLGVAVTPAVWTDPGVQWDRFDHLVIRSPWDYHHHVDAFARWLDERADAPMSNPAAVLRWNMEKTYLRDLERRGIPVIPTVWAERGSPMRLADILGALPWERAVVKPTISASAHQTWVVAKSPSAEDEQRFAEIAARSGVMVQEFMEEVTTAGEWSIVYLGGRFSHAAVKRPAAGDFRVQEEHGGSVQAATPPAWLRAQADAVMAAAPGPLLYARVDGVARNERLELMELELFEPALYLGTDAGAAVRFASALAERL